MLKFGEIRCPVANISPILSNTKTKSPLCKGIHYAGAKHVNYVKPENEFRRKKRTTASARHIVDAATTMKTTKQQ